MWPFDLVDWLMLAVPFAYLSILVGSLAVFSSLYRKRKAAKSASLEPWFPPHSPRNIYLTLLHMDEPNPPDGVLKAALMRRATEDIHRIVQIRNSKQALQVLLQRGTVGDDLWQRFQRAEKEIEEELRDVVNEANGFSDNWGQTIFQSASEIAQNMQIRERLAEVLSTAQAEKEWWEKRKATIQSEFMQELEDEKVKGPATTENSGVGSVKGGRAASDDDAVIVESGGPAEKASKAKKK
ncbi:translocation protein-like protein sec66, partial [Massariosphaeria phaeospora]